MKKMKNQIKYLKLMKKFLILIKNSKATGFGVKNTNPKPNTQYFFLAWLKAGNNSEKLKNEIRQKLYFLCR